MDIKVTPITRPVSLIYYELHQGFINGLPARKMKENDWFERGNRFGLYLQLSESFTGLVSHPKVVVKYFCRENSGNHELEDLPTATVMKQQALILQSVITCPVCGHREEETMPANACVHFYYCKSCGTRLSPKKGDCCVFCSYGSVKCPPVQMDSSCCSAK